MSRKTILLLAGVVLLTLSVAAGRLFVGIPFVPPSGREIVARLSGLPIPVFVRSEDALEECSGGFCRNYYGRGLIYLNPVPCAKAITIAKSQGWRSLPLPDDLTIAQETGAPPIPHVGYFRFEQRRPEEHTFAWIDSATCRVYAELDIT
jgi:hypothetical protein